MKLVSLETLFKTITKLTAMGVWILECSWATWERTRVAKSLDFRMFMGNMG
jgi:hypothetical protein